MPPKYDIGAKKALVKRAEALSISPGGRTRMLTRFSAQDKNWKVVDGLPINDFSRAKMDATAAELVDERDTAVAFLSQ